MCERCTRDTSRKLSVQAVLDRTACLTFARRFSTIKGFAWGPHRTLHAALRLPRFADEDRRFRCIGSFLEDDEASETSVRST